MANFLKRMPLKNFVKNCLKFLVSYLFVPLAATTIFFLFWGTVYFSTTHISKGTIQSILWGIAVVAIYLLASWGVVRAYEACKLIKHRSIGWSIVLVTFLVGMGIQYQMAVSYTHAKRSMTSEQWVHDALNAAYCEKQPCSPQSIESLVGPMRTEQEWRRLAESGDETAQSEQCSVHGTGNDIDPEYHQKVVSWCRRDAEAGNPQSQYLLARLYANGQANLPQSWVEAYFWYSVWGLPSGRRTTERDDAATHLKTQQIKAVNDRIAKWKERLCKSDPKDRNAIVWRSEYCAP